MRKTFRKTTLLTNLPPKTNKKKIPVTRTSHANAAFMTPSKNGRQRASKRLKNDQVPPAQDPDTASPSSVGPIINQEPEQPADTTEKTTKPVTLANAAPASFISVFRSAFGDSDIYDNKGFSKTTNTGLVAAGSLSGLTGLGMMLSMRKKSKKSV